jgi:adenosylcobinamide-GDP ribazoletransferase
MGVAAIVFVLLVQITALAAVTPRWLSAAALIAAVVTGRVAVLMASGAGAARSGGFGALIAGTTSRGARLLTCVALLAVAGAASGAAGGLTLAVRWLACRRLDGMTGDVYGALIEISAATVLLVTALSA